MFLSGAFPPVVCRVLISKRTHRSLVFKGKMIFAQEAGTRWIAQVLTACPPPFPVVVFYGTYLLGLQEVRGRDRPQRVLAQAQGDRGAGRTAPHPRHQRRRQAQR